MTRKGWIGWGVAAAVALFFYFFGTAALRAQMEEALSSAAGRPVQLNAVHLTLPPGIRLVGIAVPGGPREPSVPFSVGEITARLSAAQALRGAMGLSLDIRAPKLFITWTPEAQALFSWDALKNTAGSTTPLPLESLRIRGGELDFLDETAVPAVPWRLRDVAMEVSTRGTSEYAVRFSGRLAGKEQEEIGRFEGNGSVLTHGPVDGEMTFRHQKIGVLAPYLRKVLGSAPTQGSAELKSRLTVHGGVLMAHNDVTAAGVVFPPKERTTLDLEGTRLVELLRDADGKVHLAFVVAGKLGQRLDWSDLAAGALRESMRQALARSIQKVLKDTEQRRPSEEVLQEKIESLGR